MDGKSILLAVFGSGALLTAIINIVAARRLERLKGELQLRSQQALEQFKEQLQLELQKSGVRYSRAFDRRLDWYEREVRALVDFAEALDTWWTMVVEKDSLEATSEYFDTLNDAHLETYHVAAEAELYATPHGVQLVQAIMGEVQQFSDDTGGLDEEKTKGKLDRVEALSAEIRSAVSKLSADAREHLGLDRLVSA